MARDIILNLAISLDGFICDEDGGFAWISGQGDVRADTADHFDFDGFLASCDTIVMGRKAYEDCLSSLPEAAEKRFLVASRTPRAPEGRVVFLSADVVAEVLALKDAVCSPGGATIQGVRALEAGGFRSAVMEAVIAAYEKSAEMK